MENHKILKEVAVVILASIILAIAVSFLEPQTFLASFYSFLIIIFVSALVKKSYAYYLEADTKVKFWSVYHYGFKKIAHFGRPLPMLWLPLILAPIGFPWLGIIETEIIARTERVSKRHGLYRFSEMTDWHIAIINTFGIIATLILAVVGYILGFDAFSQLAVMYAIWSVIPIGGLDGTRIFFGSRFLWTTLALFSIIIFGWLMIIV
jgi:hypothetical protein